MRGRLSDAQRKALHNLSRGLPADLGLHGRSEYGGFTKTWDSLRRKGLIDRRGDITEEGRVMLSLSLGAMTA